MTGNTYRCPEGRHSIEWAVGKVIGADMKVAVVTGTNRGMGLEASRQLAQLGHRVIMTGRDRDKVLAAMEGLKSEGLDVEYRQLDVVDPSHIQSLADYIKNGYEKLDVLINSAGIYPIDPDNPTSSVFKTKAATVIKTFETNTLAPLMIAQALIPLMKGSGRVVNVSSTMGQLRTYVGGTPDYRISKTALNAVTRILSYEMKDTNVKVNCLCPGWVRTGMGGPTADRSVEEGVETIVWLATLPDDGPNGRFFRDKQEIDW